MRVLKFPLPLNSLRGVKRCFTLSLPAGAVFVGAGYQPHEQLRGKQTPFFAWFLCGDGKKMDRLFYLAPTGEEIQLIPQPFQQPGGHPSPTFTLKPLATILTTDGTEAYHLLEVETAQ